MTETQWLFKWWMEWAKRLCLTTWHLINRKAYRKWKEERGINRFIDGMAEINQDLFH